MRSPHAPTLVTPASLVALTMVGLCAALPLSAMADRGHRNASHAAGLAQEARTLIERGAQALAAGDLPAAARLLGDAYRQSQRPEALYQLGRLALAEQRSLDAYDLMRRYLADPSREPDDAALKAAEALTNQPPPAIGSVTVLSDAGALVLIDNRVVGALPLLLPLLVSPGPHNVRIEFHSSMIEAPVQVQLGRLTEVRMSRASRAVVVSMLPAILLSATGSGVPAAAERLLAEAVEQAARDEQHTLLRADLVRQKGEESRTCLATEKCRRELANQHNAELVLEQQIQVKDVVSAGPTAAAGAAAASRPTVATWQFTLRLLQVEVREPAARADSTCQSCTAEQAAARLKEAAAKLLTSGLLRPHGAARIAVTPAGATLKVGERILAGSPKTEAFWSGDYQLTASFPGYETERRPLAITERQTTDMTIELQPQGTQSLLPVTRPLSTGRTPRPRWRLAVGGAMLGAGLLIGGVGTAGLALDGSCRTSPDPPGSECPKLYDTRAVGGFAFGSGLVLVGSGILLMALPEPHR